MTAYLCVGNPPKVRPCGADIANESQAEKHAKTGHNVISATTPAVLNRYLAEEDS